MCCELSTATIWIMNKPNEQIGCGTTDATELSLVEKRCTTVAANVTYQERRQLVLGAAANVSSSCRIPPPPRSACTRPTMIETCTRPTMIETTTARTSSYSCTIMSNPVAAKINSMHTTKHDNKRAATCSLLRTLGTDPLRALGTDPSALDQSRAWLTLWYYTLAAESGAGLPTYYSNCWLGLVFRLWGRFSRRLCARAFDTGTR
jgi:hypothetical protein